MVATAEVKAVHAGLECGLIVTAYPWLDMISMGPTITGAHSPSERVSVPSTERFYEHLKAVLAAPPGPKPCCRCCAVFCWFCCWSPSP